MIRLTIVVCAGLWLMPWAGLAQEPTGDERERRAHALHAEGAELLRGAQFARARDLFQEAMALVPNGGSAFNLALAYRGTGESLEAVAMFERILEGEFGPVAEERAVDVRRWIIEERGALSVIRLTLRGADAELSIDGLEQGVVAEDQTREFRLNAGRRTFTARAEGFEPLVELVFAERASRSDLELVLQPLNEANAVYQRPGFWVGMALIALAAVGAGIAVALRPYEKDPANPEPFGVARALRF